MYLWYEQNVSSLHKIPQIWFSEPHTEPKSDGYVLGQHEQANQDADTNQTGCTSVTGLDA